MKRNLLLLSFLIFAHLSVGQVKIYPKVGMVISSQDLEFGEMENQTNREVKSKAGLLAGIGLETSIYKSVFITADLQYAQLGYIDRTLNTYHDISHQPTNHTRDTYKLNYIISPISIKKYLITGTTTSLYITGGAYSSIFTSGKHIHESKWPFQETYTSENEIEVNDWYKFDRFDWGLNFGGGLEFNLWKSEFLLDAKYSLGMSDVHEVYKSGGSRNYGNYGANGKNRFFSLGLGYVLPYPRKTK